MNKPIVKNSVKNQVLRPQQPLQARPGQNPAPREPREVGLPSAPSPQNSLIVAYKDLQEPPPQSHFAKNFTIAIGVFTLLAAGILVGQQFSKTRSVAGGELSRMIPAGAQATVSESYKYEKSCYTGENGEDVCVTRTSQAH